MLQITQPQLKELLHYDPFSGEFFWLPQSVAARTGRLAPLAGGLYRAGSIHHSGYRYFKIYGKHYSAHRLAWFYVTGVWPDKHVDHKNRNRSDNRFENLRLATRAENRANSGISRSSTSGFKGVHWHAHARAWCARISINNHRHALGYFSSKAGAARAYDDAAMRLGGDFALTNKELKKQ